MPVTPVTLAFAGGGLLLLALSFLITTDWLRLSAAGRLAQQAAEAAALATAQNSDPVDAVAARTARAVMSQPDAVVVAERGDARPGPTGLEFTAGAGEVVRVSVATTARSLVGTPFGLGLRTISATAMAQRSGVAALVERTTAVPSLPDVAAGLEAHLFGRGASLTPDERLMLGSVTFGVADLVHRLAAGRDDAGSASDVARVAGEQFKPSELVFALADLFKTSEHWPQASDVRDILGRIAAAAAASGEAAIPFRNVISLTEPTDNLELGAPLRPLEFLQAVMRASLAVHRASLRLDQPINGVDSVTLDLTSDGEAAAALIGGEDSFVGIPGVRISARFELRGLSIPGVDGFQLPLEIILRSGDARISRIDCGPTGAVVKVTGRPVRATVLIADANSTATTADTAGYVQLLAAEGVTAWGKGSAGYADDPPTELVFRPGNGQTIASLRAPIDFSNRLERLASEMQILVSLDGKGRDVMSEGGVRDEIGRMVAGNVDNIEAVLSSTFAAFGIVPGKMDVVAAGASCNNAVLMSPAK